MTAKKLSAIGAAIVALAGRRLTPKSHVRLELGILAPNPGFRNLARRRMSDLR
jgi:hypothetical protein